MAYLEQELKGIPKMIWTGNIRKLWTDLPFYQFITYSERKWRQKRTKLSVLWPILGSTLRMKQRKPSVITTVEDKTIKARKDQEDNSSKAKLSKTTYKT